MIGTRPRVLRGARLWDGRLVDVALAAGTVAALTPAGSGALDADALDGDALDAAGRLLLPAFVEPHAHLDKALASAPVAGPGLMAAVRGWIAYAERVTGAEVRARARRALEEYVDHGTGTVRTHADVGPHISDRAVRALLELRAEVSGVVDLEVVAMAGSPVSGDAGRAARAELEQALAAGADHVGGAPWLDPDPRRAIGVLRDLAVAHGRGLDLHLDETTDRGVQTIPVLLDVLDAGPTVPVRLSHVISLGALEAGEQRGLARELARREIEVVTLPRTSLWLQERDVARSPSRGITAVRALLDEGVRLLAGADNLRDVFNPWGSADPLDVARLLVLLAPVSTREALAAVSAPELEPRVGHPADLVLLGAPGADEAVSTAPPDRVVLHRGRVVARRRVERDGVPAGGW